ncbi:hypothetical protein [Bradyrhizobium sp.]
MNNFVFVRRLQWTGGLVEWAVRATELARTQDGLTQSWQYSDFRKLRFTSHVDWRLRISERCEIFLASRRRIHVWSESSKEGRQELGEFISQLIHAAQEVNPNIEYWGGFEHVRWSILLAAHFLLAGVFVALFRAAPREIILSSILALVIAAYWLLSMLLVVANRPKRISDKKIEEQHGQALQDFLSEQHDRYVAPLLIVGTFMQNPSALAENVTSGDKRSTKIAVGGVWRLLVLAVLAAEGLGSLMSDPVQMSYAHKFGIYISLLVIPVTWLFASFLIYRVVLHYENIPAAQYFRASLYVSSFFIVLEAASLLVALAFIHYFPNPPGEIESPLALGLILGFIGLWVFGWILAIVCFVRLSHAAFNINRLHAYLVNFSLLILLSGSLIWGFSK